MATPPPDTQVAMNYFPQAQKTFQPPLIANENAFLGDITTSEKQDATSPMSCGLYRLEKGTPLVYTYTVCSFFLCFCVEGCCDARRIFEAFCLVS